MPFFRRAPEDDEYDDRARQQAVDLSQSVPDARYEQPPQPQPQPQPMAPASMELQRAPDEGLPRDATMLSPALDRGRGAQMVQLARGADGWRPGTTGQRESTQKVVKVARKPRWYERLGNAALAGGISFLSGQGLAGSIMNAAEAAKAGETGVYLGKLGDRYRAENLAEQQAHQSAMLDAEVDRIYKQSQSSLNLRKAYEPPETAKPVARYDSRRGQYVTYDPATGEANALEPEGLADVPEKQPGFQILNTSEGLVASRVVTGPDGRPTLEKVQTDLQSPTAVNAQQNREISQLLTDDQIDAQIWGDAERQFGPLDEEVDEGGASKPMSKHERTRRLLNQAEKARKAGDVAPYTMGAGGNYDERAQLQAAMDAYNSAQTPEERAAAQAKLKLVKNTIALRVANDIEEDPKLRQKYLGEAEPKKVRRRDSSKVKTWFEGERSRRRAARDSEQQKIKGRGLSKAADFSDLPPEMRTRADEAERRYLDWLHANPNATPAEKQSKIDEIVNSF